MNSSLSAIPRSKRRAAAAAEHKIKMLAADEQDYDEEEASADASDKRNNKENAMAGSKHTRVMQDTKRKRACFGGQVQPESPRSDALSSKKNHNRGVSSSTSSISSSSSLSRSSSFCGLSDSDVAVGDAEGCTGSDHDSNVANSNSVDGVSTFREPVDIDSVLIPRTGNQRRRAMRQINSSGTMYLSGHSYHRINKDRKSRRSDDGDVLSPIVARTLELTPVANVPTTPASRYRLTTGTTEVTTAAGDPLSTVTKSTSTANIGFHPTRRNGATSTIR